MQFRLAVGGVLPDDPGLQRQVDELLGQVKASLYEKESTVDIHVLFSPSYMGGAWAQRMDLFGLPKHGYCLRGGRDKLGPCDHVMQIETPLRNVVGEALCDSADLLLVVWNEEVLECGGASWELIQLAYRHGTPCIWISSGTGNIYWPQGAYYEPYSTEKLRTICRDIRTDGVEPKLSDEGNIPMLGLGVRLRERYLRKYSAYSPETKVEADHLLEMDFPLEQENEAGAPLWKEMLCEFLRFDQAAVNLNSRYQAVIYWRAILPLLATIFLAVGFYAEKILGAFGLPGTLLTLIAGLGFLVNGLLNLYVYMLSRNGTIWQWHQGFVENRSIAEMLRVLLHFVPYGVNLNLRKLCGKNQKLWVTLRRIVEKMEPAEQEVSHTGVTVMLTHAREMIEDQLAYHTASAQRFDNIVRTLERWNRWVFGIGFVVVLMRSILQFVLAFVSIQGSEDSSASIAFIQSFANMLALMLPAWASYFASKAALCNFRYNLENNRRMIEILRELLRKLDDMKSTRGSIPMEALSSLIEEIADALIIKDTSAWRNQYMETTVKLL